MKMLQLECFSFTITQISHRVCFKMKLSHVEHHKHLHWFVLTSIVIRYDSCLVISGTEIVIAGALNSPTSTNLITQISASSADGPLVFNMAADDVRSQDQLVLPSAATLKSKLERLWAYLTIKEVLEKVTGSDNSTEKEFLKQKALDLSLKVLVSDDNF